MAWSNTADGCGHPTWNGAPETCMFQACFSTFHAATTSDFHAWNFQWQYWRVYYSMHDSWNMHVTGRDLGCFTGRYHARYMHELLPDISCMFHAWNLVDFMHETCMFQTIFHAWYRRIPCLVQAYSMRGTDVFHAWSWHIPCVVQARVYHAWYRYSHACTIYSTGSCTIQ